MEVYEFNKDCVERYEELKIIFDNFVSDMEYNKISASEIHSLWVDYAEITIEPTGWTALWRVSRVICEELKIKYPAVIYGMVENVLYKELKCIFKIIAVEDEDIHLPETHEVPLDELYPTIMQENSEVNTSTTANSLDQLRFFYQQLWMPWDSDNDDDVNWFHKNLQLRLDFFYDIKLKRIERYMANHINNLLMEARNIQRRREYLELDLSDAEDNEEADRTHAKDLIKLHLRMNMIKNEIDMLQNPKMRVAYKEINFNRGDSIKPRTHSNDIYLVLQEGNLTDKINYLKFASNIVDNTKTVITCSSLQEVLNKSDYADIIYIPSGKHSITFHESFNSNGAIKTITGTEDVDLSENAIISATDDERMLMSFDGDFTLENVTLDCRNVRTGILVHNGCVVLKNCKLFDDGKSAVKQGIVVVGKATVKLINCVINQFATGITLKPDANVLLLDNTIITNCDVGIEMEDDCELGLYSSTISNCKSRGVYIETKQMAVLDQKKKTYDAFSDTNLKSVVVNSHFKFENNKYGNIVVCNKRMSEMYRSSLIGSDFIAPQDTEMVNGTVERKKPIDDDEEDEDESSVILIDDSIGE